MEPIVNESQDRRSSGVSPVNDEAVLIAWLAERDTPCPLCQYNLRGLTSPRCPECGQEVRLSVSLVEPYLKAWIAVVVGLLPPAGFGAFFLLVMAREGDWRELNHTPFWGCVGLIYIVLCIPVSVLALARRRQFQRLKRPVQHLMAATVWIALLVAVVSVVAQMR